MIRSLYIRTVLTFLISVIAGTVIAFIVTYLIFQERLNDNLQATLYNFGQDIIRVYETLPLREADEYVKGMKQLNAYSIQIFDESGLLHSYGSSLNKQYPETDQVKKVLRGGVVQINPTTRSSSLLGLPLSTDSGARALFVEPLIPASSLNIKWLFYFTLCSLIGGSLIVLVATIYLIRPIKKLTVATKRIAAGDFNVELHIRQKGELGTLAHSFEQMTHDLQQLEQMRRDFVANVSHEVQSPLTSISGYTAALKQTNITDHDRDRYLDIIINEAKRMSKMSDSLLKLSQLESQSKQLRLTRLSLDEQIRRVIVALQPQWSARRISFELQLQPVSLNADHELLNQVWTNILGNSIKFSEEGGVIDVSVNQDNKDVTVSISDTGIGIPPEDQKRIFERFFKTDRAHSRKYAGSGMGLAIVKQIVSLHQGSIRVESEYGKGTTMIVTLPVSSTK